MTDDRGTYYVSDEKRRGVHWALLVIDVENGTSYYGESLGWSVPGNLADTVGSNLKRMEEISVITALENVIDMNKFSCDASNTGSTSCKLFCPLQSCSHVCGVIVVCMAAVLCDYWEIWLSCGGKENGGRTITIQPINQQYAIVMSWIVNDNVTATHLIPQKNDNQNVMSKKRNALHMKGIKLMLASATLRLPWNILSK